MYYGKTRIGDSRGGILPPLYLNKKRVDTTYYRFRYLKGESLYPDEIIRKIFFKFLDFFLPSALNSWFHHQRSNSLFDLYFVIFE